MPTEETITNEVEDIAVIDGISEEALNSDPEFKAMLEAEKSTPRGDDDKNTEGDTEDTGVADDEENVKDGDVVDEQNSDDENIDDMDFADDVIAGLKGSDLKKLPKEALVALADFVENNKSLSGESTKTKESLEKLLADPIVKRRMELLQDGKQEYEVRGINEKEKRSIIERFKEKCGLDDDEAQDAFNIMKEGVDSAVKDAANDALQNIVVANDSKRKASETEKKGRQAFLNLGKFNKDFAFKETDPNNFWKLGSDGKTMLNDKHPEAAKFREKVYPVMSALAKAGVNYETMVKMLEEFGDEGVYALAARKLGLPVAFNTAERDKKIIASEVRKKLAPFIRGAGNGELSAKGGSPVVENGRTTIRNGYDVVRLATDSEYYENALMSKPGDKKHMDMLSSLQDEGDQLSQKQRTKK